MYVLSKRENLSRNVDSRRKESHEIFWNSKEVYISFLEASAFSPMAF